jgi:dihydrofolate synthase/folylpolyglutamate synthase
MNYSEAVDHLYALGPELAPSDPAIPRRKFDLAHMRRLCAALGDPHLRVPSVLIAGTNGKGSTAATLASILTAAGYRTGLYTSPHLTRVNERIQLSRPTLPTEYGSLSAHNSEGALDLSPIADDDFARLYTLVDETCETLVATGDLPGPPSFFERLTAIAFAYYASADEPGVSPRAEIMVLEVGLGGRLDATNIVEPLVSVITDIALDHQDYLGDTLTEIAGEKAGILRQNGVLVTLSQHPEANQAIGLAAARLNVRGVNAAQSLPPAQRNDSAQRTGIPRNRYTLPLDDALLEVDSPLFGVHQQRNLALAIATAIELRNQNGYNIADTAISKGISNTRWPGRLEFLTPNLLLDVAHNPAGAWTLRAAIAALPESQPRTLLFSCLRDKDLAEMSRILFPLFDSSPDSDPLRRHDHIVLAPIPNLRAAAVEDLLLAAHALGIPAHAAPHLAGALAQAREITPPGGIIIATGSVYLIGELRELALHQTPHPSEVLA